MKIYKKMITVGLCFILSSTISAQWIQTSFPNHVVSCLASKESNLFAGTWGQGMFRSTDNGTTWTEINNGLPDFYARWVYSLAVVPSSGGGGGTNLFAGMEYGGVYRSTDDGDNWIAVNSGLGSGINIVALGVAGSTILAGAAQQPGLSGVYRSVNDGETWTRCNSGFVTQADSNVYCFASTTTGSTTYFYAGTGGGVFISNTDGTSWTRISNGLPPESISALAVNPGSGGISDQTLFAGVGYSGAFSSTDNGSSWTQVNEGFIYTPLIADFIVSSVPNGTVGTNNIFAIEAGHVYESTNNGTRWWDTGCPYGTGILKCLTINGDYLFVGAEGGIWKYSLIPDTGWVVQQSGTSETLYSVKAVDDNVVWTAGTNGEVFRTTNGGAAWTSVGGGIIGSDVIYTVEALDDNIAFIAANSNTAKIYKTTNGGGSWSLVFSQTDGFIGGIQMKTVLEGYAVGSPVGGKWTVLKTTDGGNTWARLITEPAQVGNEQVLLAVQLLGNTIWFGTTEGKVYRSTDLGLTWISESTTGSLVYGLHFNSSSTGLTGLNGGTLNLSTNGGDSWNSVSAASSQDITCISGVNNEFWATTGSSIAYTNTNGQTWISSSPGFSGIVPLWAVSISPTSSNLNGWAVGESGMILHYQRNATSIKSDTQALLAEYTLEQNYPNPFNPSTSIQYAIASRQFIQLKVYDFLGREVATLVNEEKSAGRYEVNFDARSLSSGIYFYNLQAGSFSETKKLILLK